jgi:hypothetical protein
MVLSFGVALKDGSEWLFIHFTVSKCVIAAGVRDPDQARADAAMAESKFASHRSL